ncbi:MAG: DNA recombination protein RmuC [Actinomycetota bacterium]|nr:DNA recombination protein RmuC [Actinomycetota bacterium]
MTSTPLLWLIATVALIAGAAVASLVARGHYQSTYAAQLAAASAERDVLRERVVDLEATLSEGSETAQMIAPLRHSLEQVARQVHDLERDRGDQFARVASELTRVAASTTELRTQTASLVGSLNASSVRGSWGEVQLRRVLEHAGMLARCDVDEQVSGTTADGHGVRPDVVVHLPGGKDLVIDAKAPMSAFLAAQAEGLTADERSRHLAGHARALRHHVDALAAKAYWTALPVTPEMVVCFVPGEAFLTAALASDPDLHEHAMRRRVVLASPGTLLALLRTVAFTWQQDALVGNARELLVVGRELYDRLGSLGQHATRMGAALQRSVEAYNGFIGSLESRVLVSARRMQELGLVDHSLPPLTPVETAGRPLTAVELLESLEPDVARPTLRFDEPGSRGAGRSASAG